MGNFLFQAARAIAYAKEHGLAFTLPNSTSDPKWNPIYLQHLVNKDFDDSLPTVRIIEKQFNYQILPFKESWRDCNIVLDGYWQSEKYFKRYRDDILRLFGFEWKPIPFVSIHIRRGDYLTIKKGNQLKHPPVPIEWIRAAMALFSPGRLFLVFSDDIEWCRDTFRQDDNVICERGANEQDDLIKMSWCEHHICSASTFSWWGAWLNRNPAKRVIMPPHWLSPGWGGLNTSDVVPSEWERLSL